MRGEGNRRGTVAAVPRCARGQAIGGAFLDMLPTFCLLYRLSTQLSTRVRRARSLPVFACPTPSIWYFLISMKTPLPARVRGLLASAVLSLALTAPLVAAPEGNDPVTVTDNGHSWTLDNGIVKATINKHNGTMVSLCLSRHQHHGRRRILGRNALGAPKSPTPSPSIPDQQGAHEPRSPSKASPTAP